MVGELMYATVISWLPHGIEGRVVEVQCDISAGQTAFNLVGLASASVREARDRLPAAFRNSGLEFPHRKVTLNLAPAELRKDGGGLDLAMAVAVSLALQGRTAPAATGFIGELGLEGSLRHADGV